MLPVPAPGVTCVMMIVSVLVVAIFPSVWYTSRLRVAPLMAPVVGSRVPVIDPGGGMLAGVLPCTPNDPAVIVSVTAHVAVELVVQAGSVAADASPAWATKPRSPPAIRKLASATLTMLPNGANLRPSRRPDPLAR